MSVRAGVLAGAALVLLAACGGGGEPDAAPVETVTVTSTPTYLGDPTEAVTETPTGDADSYAPNVGERALQVGQQRVGRGVTTVLLETDLGVSKLYYEPEAGKQFLGLRISMCVRKGFDNAEPVYSTYNGEWYAATKSGDQYTAGSSYPDFPSPKFPESVTLLPGDCLKGWLAIEVPAGARTFEKIIYRPGGETLAEWVL